MILKTLLFSVLLVGIAVLFLGIGVFTRGRAFPRGHVHDSEELRKRGVECHRDM